MAEHGESGLFPVFLRLEGKPCTVIGGGEVAARKARALLEAGARVKVIAPGLGEGMRRLLGRPQLEHVARVYQPGDLAGCVLAFAATDDPQVNAAVFREAQERGILVNVVDDPVHCNFIVPSRLDRSPITIAISTHGASPALARHLRARLEQAVPAEYQALARLLGRLRPEVMAAVPSSEERGRRWQQVLESDALSLLGRGKEAEAEAMARRVLGLPAKQVPPQTVAIGTRGSRLALAQTQQVASMLAGLGIPVRTKVIRTSGDRSAAPPGEESRGIFVREIEEALLRGEVNLAVHSLKDLPTLPRQRLAVAAIPERADPRDAVVTRTGSRLAELPAGSRVATSSPRRVAQLKAYRPDLVFQPVRGNVDTRLRKLKHGEFDALVLAYAGLLRLGLVDGATEVLSPGVCLPAPGQGALAIQVREDDGALQERVQLLDHRPSRLAVTAERAFLAGLGAGCTVPAGALGVVEADRLILTGVVADPGGRSMVRQQTAGPTQEAEALGRRLAEAILAAGGDRILAELQ